MKFPGAKTQQKRSRAARQLCGNAMWEIAQEWQTAARRANTVFRAAGAAPDVSGANNSLAQKSRLRKLPARGALFDAER
jgi:hypothetical protein